MKVLVLGNGGREHALAWKISQSEKVEKVFLAPQNDGIDEKGKIQNLNLNLENFDNIIEFVKEENIDLTVVGPEKPLCKGIVDEFKKNNLKIFGPTQAAAKLESDKAYAKEFMLKHHIPTAKFKIFDDIDVAVDYIRTMKMPVVIKAAGLAAGKGVFICNTLISAINAVKEIMIEKIFGDSGSKIVVEEFMDGYEMSIFAVSDGKNYVLLPPAQDHKRIGEGDIGLNTGGMGAYAPFLISSNQLFEEIEETIISRTFNSLRKEGIEYKGLLYFGLMITKENKPKVVEYNCRFGDPETQAILPLIKSDFADLLYKACIEDGLKDYSLKIKDLNSVCVVIASNGYPLEYETGFKISGLDEIEINENNLIFYSGVKRIGKNLVNNGGRVLNVVGIDKSLRKAIQRAYSLVDKIKFHNMYYRKDIGEKGVEKDGG